MVRGRRPTRCPPARSPRWPSGSRRDRPDVLLVHHSRADLLGQAHPGAAPAAAGAASERRPRRSSATRRSRPRAPRAWDKVLRRELLASGAALRPRRPRRADRDVAGAARRARHRDAAARPSTSATSRRTASAGARRSTCSRSTRRCWRAAGERRALVEPAMLRHELALLSAVPEAERREFFARMSRPAARSPARPVARLRAQLVQRDALRRPTSRSRSRWPPGARCAAGAQRLAAQGPAARRARAASMKAYYRRALRRPIDPQPRRLRRLLVPRLLVQPARDLREGARARARHARRLGRRRATASDALPAGVEHVVARHAASTTT